jgi:hypothetical protein
MQEVAPPDCWEIGIIHQPGLVRFKTPFKKKKKKKNHHVLREGQDSLPKKRLKRGRGQNKSQYR